MIDAPLASAAGPRPHRPWLAAVLSFVFPGLGQAYAGRYRPALVLAVPALLLVLVVLGLLTGVIGGMRNNVLSSDFLVAVLLVNGVLLAWRGVAIAHGGLTPWPLIQGHDRRTSVMVVIGLLVVSVAMHGWIAGVVVQLNDTLGQVFGEARSGGLAPPAGGDEEGEEPDDPVNQPEFRWDGTDVINVLLLGTDAAPGREAVLTDVLLVVSIDPVARSAVMISVPRDTGYVPLPDESLYPGALFPDKVNELAARASLEPATWCPDLADDAEACGLRTVERTVGLYLGIEIHHYALIDMAGFAQMIDALGGLELCLPGRLVDPEFDGSLGNRQSREPLVLPAGCHHYNGLDALAYARSRKGWIEMPDGTRVQQSDFERNERQQQVLLAMRRELAEADTFLELPDLLRAIGRTVSTDFPRDQAGDLASLLPVITGPDIERVVLGYPEFVELPADPSANYLLVPKRDAIRDEMARLFGRQELTGWYLATDAPGPGSEPAAEAPTP
ncbi:MAG: LCP family protein [Chloroflexota bacterium]|nr:LCP family protein [Chloroflexota bacterium]